MQREVNPVLVELAKKHDVKVVATNDVHFVEEEHAEWREGGCLQTTKTLTKNQVSWHLGLQLLSF